MAVELDRHSRPLDQAVYDFIATLYALLALVAFLLNTLVIFTFSRDRSLWLPTNLLVLSISIGDWLMAVMANPLGAAANASEAWPLTKGTCAFYAFLTTTLGFGAMLHHTAIAIERYLSISRPYMAELPNKVVYAVISGLWAFAFFWALFPLLGWSAYVPEGGNTACSIRWQSEDYRDASYIYTVFVCFFFGPVLAIAFSYALIYRSVKVMAVNAVRMWGPNAAPTLEIVNARAKTARMSFLMVAGFLMGWTPYAIASLYAVTGHAQEISAQHAVIPSMFAKTTIVYNPVIYFFTYRGFRISLKNSLRRLFLGNVVVPVSVDVATLEQRSSQQGGTREFTISSHNQ